MSKSPKFHQTTKNTWYKSRICRKKKKGKIKTGWHREAQHHSFLGTRRSGTSMQQQQQHSSNSAGAQQQQQQHSRSSSGGGDGGGGEGGVGGGSTASLFLQNCRSSTVVHQKERRGHINKTVETPSPRLTSILVHMLWPPLLLDLLLLCRRRRRYCCCCCCCCCC